MEKAPLEEVCDLIAKEAVGAADRASKAIAEQYERFGDVAGKRAKDLRASDTQSDDMIRESDTGPTSDTSGRSGPPDPPSRRPSNSSPDFEPGVAEQRMRARRLAERRQPTAEMRSDMQFSSSDVFLVRSDDGELNMLIPDHNEFRWPLPFENVPGAMANRELAAFRVSDLLGLDIVPPTARTDGLIGDEGPAYPGVIRQFVESTPARADITDYRHLRQQQTAALDYIIGNLDRIPQNYRTVLDGDEFDVVAIDHGRSFPESDSPEESLRVKILSGFTASHRGADLDADILRGIDSVDSDLLRSALSDAGLSEKAVEGAVTRFETIKEARRIPATARASWY